jgi:hypothetical protein
MTTANTGFVLTGLSFVTIGIIGFILTENQAAVGAGSSNNSNLARSNDYNMLQLVKIGCAGMVVIGFGVTIISAAGITRDDISSSSNNHS